MKLVATRKSDQNRASMDPWTVVHLSAGLAFGLMNVPIRWALSAAVAYELAEQVFQRFDWGQEFFKTSGPEVVPNAIVDTAIFAVGHWLGRKWNES